MIHVEAVYEWGYAGKAPDGLEYGEPADIDEAKLAEILKTHSVGFYQYAIPLTREERRAGKQLKYKTYMMLDAYGHHFECR